MRVNNYFRLGNSIFWEEGNRRTFVYFSAEKNSSAEKYFFFKSMFPMVEEFPPYQKQVLKDGDWW